MKKAKSLTLDEEVIEEIEKPRGYSSSEIVNAILKKMYKHSLTEKDKAILENIKR